MKVILVSQDPDLLNMCREILNEYHGLAYHLSLATPGASLSGGDLYIWDGAEMVYFTPEIDQPFPKHLLLLQQSEVVRLQADLGTVGAAILLKPVTRACLSAFLGFAVSTFQDRISTPHSLRSDRNEM